MGSEDEIERDRRHFAYLRLQREEADGGSMGHARRWRRVVVMLGVSEGGLDEEITAAQTAPSGTIRSTRRADSRL